MRNLRRVQTPGLLLSMLFGLCVPVAEGATVAAASCSLQDVRAAVDKASDGDVVAIPGGSCSWSGGISTSKQIRIQAQSYTPTSRGTLNRSVTLTNNSSSPLITLASGNTYHVGVGGIRFNEGSGSGNHVRFTGSGSKVPLLYDSAFEISNRFGSAADATGLAILSQGAAIWNSYFNGVGGGQGGQCCPEGSSILVNSPRSWNTASTMGALDSGGNVNVYVEDSTLMNIGQAPDVDDNGRFVMRYSTLDGAWGITHGFTSSTGGRHFEYYNNTFSVTNGNRNMAGRYFWVRAGTGIFTDNVVNNASNPGEWGSPVLFQIGDNTSPQGQNQARRPGWGHNGSTNVVDPIYAWNNSGSRANSWNYNGQPGGWESTVVAAREVFVNAGAKPGYAKFTYPHPARSVVESKVIAPMVPQNVSLQ